MVRNIRIFLIIFIPLSSISFLSIFFSSCGQSRILGSQCRSDEYYDFDLEECVLEDSRRSSSRRTNLRTSSGRNNLRSVNDDIRYRRLRESDFEGENCNRSRECEDLCDYMGSRNDFQDECEDLPEDMVEFLYETYQDFEVFSSSSSSNFNVSAFGTLVNIDKKIILDIVEDEWSELNAAEFLVYIASHRPILSALESEDRDEELFEEVLKTFNRGSSNHFQALLKSLQRYRQTFISEAVESDNEDAVVKAFDFISNKNDFICQRTEKDRVSSRYSSTGSECHYLNSDSRRLKSSDYCYVYGPSVWSYINNNLSDGRITFTGYLATNDLNEEACEVWCRGHLRCEYEE